MSVNEDFKNPAIAENNIYKYRVGKKWFSFDKSILPPEDLRIFELANWQDKLKLITIYKDLKHVEDDSVMILKTKTEKPTKDKRRNLYNEKRRKLNEQLVEANEKNNTAEIEKIVKEIKELNVEFADVINIDTAETVNITRANNVVLNDVKNIINKVNETVRTLTDEDFKTIKNDVEQLVQAKTEQDLTNTINAIKTKMEEISDNSLSPTVEAGVNKINDLIKELERKLDSVDLTPDFEAFKYIFGDKYGWNDLTNLKIIEKIEELKTRAELTDADVNEIITYKEPIKTEIEKYNNKQTLAFIAHIGTYIRIYKTLTSKQFNTIIWLFDADKGESTTKGFRILTNERWKGDSDVKTVFESLDLFELKNNDTLVIKCKNVDDSVTSLSNQKRFEVFDFNVNFVEDPTEDSEKTLDIVKTIIDNEDTPAEEETRAVETGGFLGLRTNKQAKKEIEELKKEFLTKLQEQAEQIKALKKEIEQLRETQALRAFQQEQPQTTQPQTTQPQILTAPRIKTPVLYTSEDLEQAAKNLKHVQPVRLSEPFGRNTQPELTDLEKVLKRRRADIEYTDDLTDDEDYFADGLKGGLLGELQRDLDKYGLVLSLSPDKTAYFVNVFNRKKTRGSGVEEAKKIVNSVNDNTQYKDLKKLYEDLYED